MDVFLSYSHTDKALAARLRRRLEIEGVSFNDPVENGISWRQQVEKAIRSADAILLLLSSRKKVDERQQLTWMVALQAVWADPAKPMVPVLLQDAELPAFVRSGASGDFVQAIRLRNRKDLDPAVDAILQSLGLSHRRGLESNRFFETYPVVTEGDRVRQQENFAAIGRYVEQLKLKEASHPTQG